MQQFKAAEFKADLEENDQSISFCGVGAHHQNGVAERYIRMFIERARTVLLNAHARWPGKLDMELWTYALNHVVTQWNDTPRADLNYRTPDEIFWKTAEIISIKKRFKHFHPFGCPAYVLHKDIIDGKKHPKWKPKTKVGVCLSRSRDHA